MKKQQFDAALHRELTETLHSGGIEDAELEAKWILEDIPDAERAREIARRRTQHEPLQYLLGTWEFYGLPLLVGEGVLIPRADTETLVDAVLQRTAHIQSPQIVDLCTGTGCIALALKSQRPDADVTGIDISRKALSYAEPNALRLHLDVRFRCGDVTDPAVCGQFRGLDVITCNPPYLTAEDMAHLQPEVTHEPSLALAGGADGLDFYRVLTRLWRDSLRAGGLLAYEIGCTQAKAVAAILSENGFTGIGTVRDLNGMDRVVLGYQAE